MHKTAGNRIGSSGTIKKMSRNSASFSSMWALAVVVLIAKSSASFQLHRTRSPLTDLAAVQGRPNKDFSPTSSSSFDPLDLASASWDEPRKTRESDVQTIHNKVMDRSLVASMTSLAGLALIPKEALAGESPEITQMFDPGQFQPVCPASDGFYRFLKGSVEAVVGSDGVQEYGPLIAGGLLRVRLELCVVESFFNEAVGPFIAQNGFSWILP